MKRTVVYGGVRTGIFDLGEEKSRSISRATRLSLDDRLCK